LINLDFADVKTIMSGMGLAMMGTGVGEGSERAVDAARRAISSPLLEGASVNGARGVIINVTGGSDLSLAEVNEASTIVQEAADEDANIIFGAVVDPALKGKVKITVIATGFGPQVGTQTRLPQAPGATPVDMSAYSDAARAKGQQPPAAAPTISTARRAAFDLPFTSSASAGADPNAPQPDFDLHSPFDVPAFLRRQEG